MRKKTIEEELKEIQEEKEDHIEQLEKQFGHSQTHRYDFSPEEKQESKFDAKINKSKLPSDGSHDKDFTVEDYKKMIELEERELSDEEFDEYYALCDRFGDISDETRDRVEALYDILYSSKSNTTSVQSTTAKIGSDNSYAHLQNSTRTTNSKHQSAGGFIFPIIFLCFFVAAGLGVTIFAGIVPWVKSVNFVQVTATVESVEGYYRDDDYTYARLLIKYDFEEQQYTQVPLRKKVNYKVEEGYTFQIYVNSKKPTEIKSENNGGYVFPTIFGIVFAGFALLMQTTLIVQTVKARRKRNNMNS